MVFHWSLGDCKSHQISRTLLSILAGLISALILIVCTRPFISESSSPFTNLLVTVVSAPITLGITVTFMFQCCFRSLAESTHLSFFSFSFSFIQQSARTANSTMRQIFCFFLILLSLVVWPSLGDPFVFRNS